MPQLRVHNFSMSVDGFAAGANQDLDNPMGVGGMALHEWVFETAGGRRMIGSEGGAEGIDNDYFAAGEHNIGATIMGRNMFGPIRGDWGDDEWRGWWGDTPPYHHPVFVFTHHPHEPIEMAGGTTFYFVDDALDAVLGRAFDAAEGRDVRLGGGVSTVQQYMRAGLVDRLHIPISPVVLGAGERLFDGVDAAALGYEVVKAVPSGAVMHIEIAKR